MITKQKTNIHFLNNVFQVVNNKNIDGQWEFKEFKELVHLKQ